VEKLLSFKNLSVMETEISW